MGTEVLRPQDCLIRQVPSFRNPNPNPNPRSKKRREGSPRPRNQLLMGQVTILKRGESLDSNKVKLKEKERERKPVVSDPRVFALDPLGPDPNLVPRQIRLVGSGRVVDVYAGSACSLSPSPRKVPLPNFSKRSEESATKDLRRLLRLD